MERNATRNATNQLLHRSLMRTLDIIIGSCGTRACVTTYYYMVYPTWFSYIIRYVIIHFIFGYCYYTVISTLLENVQKLQHIKIIKRKSSYACNNYILKNFSVV